MLVCIAQRDVRRCAGILMMTALGCAVLSSLGGCPAMPASNTNSTAGGATTAGGTTAGGGTTGGTTTGGGTTGGGTAGGGTTGGGTTGGTTSATTVDVAIEGVAFVPKAVTVHSGDTVRWTNHDQVPHTATSGDPSASNVGAVWNSGTLSPGGTFSRQFNTVGTFEYYCQIHYLMAPAMRHATVNVLP